MKRQAKAQKELYQRYAPLMRAICMRYTHDFQEAEDMVQEGFIKVFTKIDQYAGTGNFEGWLKKVFINTTINHIKKNKNLLFHYDISEVHYTEDAVTESNEDYFSTKTNILDVDFSEEEILKIINKLPDGYRVVFNLYAVEQMNHKEISDMLNISISTSKSQLFRARKTIQKCLIELAEMKVEHRRQREDKQRKKSPLRLIV
ncbi:MAG: sigma-70 family RNA polymerase sigma factor [Bacteroidales bacterium]|nr:sigma-70 family RNA polymerase sigma factor [Bacteroidales bacterium]MCF8455323.1 sigma-70 family RNA polymerase sigma factor [Bacteroidales bacterium]